jgi:hypothetical protein
MKVYLEQNSGDNSQTVPYYANIEIASITVDLESRFQVPLWLQTNGRDYYTADICGFEVEGDSPEAVIALIERLMPQLVNLARLPTYVFIARRSRKMFPVYTRDDEVFATTPGGPLFKHVELAKVREYLTDYMHTIGALGAPGKSEKLHVRGVDRDTLELVRPIFYLKKRAQQHDDNEFWAPVFASDRAGTIYTYAASGKREVEKAEGHELFWLRSQVAQALMADKRLKEDYDLRPDRLLPEYWAEVKQVLKPLPSRLAYDGTRLEVYQKGKHVVAVEPRETEDRYNLYISPDLEDLRSRVAKELVRRRIISAAEKVKIGTS